MRRIRWLLLGLLLAWTLPASAQLPVEEVGWNLALNGVQASEALFQSAQWVIDLLPLEAWDAIEGAMEDLALLRELALQAQLIGMDIDSVIAQLNALFNLDLAPTTSFEFRERVGEINRRIYEVYGYAMRVQTLINSVVRTVDHILGLVEIMRELIGKLSVEQNIGQQLAKLKQIQAEHQTVMTAFVHAQSTQALAPGVLQQGIQNITDAMMEGHPSW
jgi:hypothetical protein